MPTENKSVEPLPLLATGAEPKPYPDRLCHVDYTAHPYRCGCLSGDEETQRRFDEYRRDIKQATAESEVARLTAERDALQQRLSAADQRIDEQAGLLRRCVMAVREQHCDPDEAEFDLPAELMADIDAQLSASTESGQDDDWHMNPCKQGHRDVGASGGVAACNQCNEKIEAATTQEAFERWNATHPPPNQLDPDKSTSVLRPQKLLPPPFKVSQISGSEHSARR
ncbi:hypothetical protein [Pseudomonas sp. MWU16-30322]|uniref:CHASE3 domain-containing protein n=1 Tax=Pseudomonas sp. MWU16-30322 TaxID=2878092 RepID=UPI001CF9A201|nr:hypothetical protein [Pseudomonas sp. MWU16-30322]